MLGISYLWGKLALALTLLRDDVLRLEGKAFWVAGTQLAGVWEVSTGNCCLSPSANTPCRHSPVPAVPWGIFGVSVGSVGAEASPGACSEQPLAEGPWAALYPCPSQRCPGSPVPVPGMRVWHAACHGQDTAGTAPLCKSKAQELLLPFLGLPVFSLPTFPASWDTLREHQGPLLAVSRSH